MMDRSGRSRSSGTHLCFSDDDVRLLQLLAQGFTVTTIARRLDLSERTVRRRQRAICDRLQVGASIQAVVWAAKRGVV